MRSADVSASPALLLSLYIAPPCRCARLFMKRLFVIRAWPRLRSAPPSSPELLFCSVQSSRFSAPWFRDRPAIADQIELAVIRREAVFQYGRS